MRHLTIEPRSSLVFCSRTTIRHRSAERWRRVSRPAFLHFAAVFLCLAAGSVQAADGGDWKNLVDDGFGDSATSNPWVMHTEFGRLFLGIYNWSTGAEMWRSQDGAGWQQLGSNGFGDVNNVGFPAMSYATSANVVAGTSNSVTGTEIWSVPISNATIPAQINTDGFGEPGNTDASAMANFRGQLYVGTRNVLGAELWSGYAEYPSLSWVWHQVNANGFGDLENIGIASLAEFRNQLYAGTSNLSSGAQIWRSPDGVSWSRVANGGFGDPNNVGLASLLEFEGVLYAGTVNEVSGAEIWRSADGSSWSQINFNGMGDARNRRITSLATLDGRLFAGTENPRDGAQVWKSTDGSTWVREVAGGFGDTFSKDVTSMSRFVDGSLYAGLFNPTNGAQVWKRDGVDNRAAWRMKRLTASDGVSNDRFGWTVAAAPSTIATGNGINDLYLFLDRSGGSWSHPTEVKIQGPGDGDRFVDSLAINGQTVVVGDFDSNVSTSGLAYLFSDTSAAQDWSSFREVRLLPTTTAERFGRSVSVFDSMVVVGAPGPDAGGPLEPDGEVFIFQDTSAGNDWSQYRETNIAVPSSPPTGYFDGFGSRVTATVGQIAVVSGRAFMEPSGSAAVHVIADTSSQGDWSSYSIAEIAPEFRRLNDYFGGSVAFTGETLVVSAEGAGEIHLFRDSSAAGDWSRVTERVLTASDITDSSFGAPLAGSWPFLAAMESSQAFYVYQDLGEDRSWTKYSEIRLERPGESSLTGFGWSVAATGSLAVASDIGFEDDRGALYVYTPLLFGDGFESGDSSLWFTTPP